MYRALCREDRGIPLKCDAIPGVRLMLQQLHIGGQEFNLVLPADIDAIMDMYIASGTSPQVLYTVISLFCTWYTRTACRLA